MTRRRRKNRSGGGIDISTLLLLGVGGYLAYEWYSSNYSTQVTLGTAANPITVSSPPPTLIATGPLASVPVGPALMSTGSGDVGVAGYFDSTGMW